RIGGAITVRRLGCGRRLGQVSNVTVRAAPETMIVPVREDMETWTRIIVKRAGDLFAGGPLLPNLRGRDRGRDPGRGRGRLYFGDHLLRLGLTGPAFASLVFGIERYLKIVEFTGLFRVSHHDLADMIGDVRPTTANQLVVDPRGNHNVTVPPIVKLRTQF